MTFIDQNLVPGEQIAHRAKLHWMVFVLPVGVLALGVLLLGLLTGHRWIGGSIIALGAVLAIRPYVFYQFSEFGVTDRRVLAKLGLVSRQSLDQLLDKIEAVQVDQDIPGRLLGYGSVTVIGTGGTRETFARIADPYAFRRAIQERIIALQGSRGPAAAPAAPPRLERKCPWCAEMILTDARVCKHCGRSVPAA